MKAGIVALALGSVVATAAAGDLAEEYWMWGHHPDSFDVAAAKGENYNFPKGRRIDMADACRSLGVGKCCVVRWRGLPAYPYDDYARQFTNLDEIAWSIVDSGKESFAWKQDEALRLAGQHQNLTTFFLDDFFNGDWKRLPPADLEAFKRRARAVNPKSRLACVLYADENGINPEFKSSLDVCDVVSLWFWNGKSLPTMRAKVEELRRLIGPEKKVLLGIYLWDFGGKKPLTRAETAAQLATAEWLLDRKLVNGLIFHCTPLVDLNLESVDCARSWLRNRKGGGVRLAKDGKALAKIVVAADADKAARFAAQELKHHLDAITGTDFEIVTDAAFGSEESCGTGILPVQNKEGANPQVNGRDARSTTAGGSVQVNGRDARSTTAGGSVQVNGRDARSTVILVGETALSKVKKSDFKLQEWLVDVSPERIVLAGRDKDDKGEFTLAYDTPIGIQGKGWPDFYDEQGTMYAVYDFLEKECGVIWADAEDDGTVIRKNPNLSVAVTSRRRQPFVFYRGGSATGDVDNSFFNRNTPRFKEYRQLAYSHPKTIAQQNRLFMLRHRAGGRLANANHSFGAFWDRFLHKDSKRFEAYHPEYFAKGYVGKDPPQLCFGSQAVVDQVVKDIRAYFDQDPKTGRFNLGPDNYCLEGADNGSFCLCDICRPQYEDDRSAENGRESTYWFGFVKRVADEILKSHPDKQISTLAYHSHEALPHGVKLPKNVVVYFCLYANRMPYAKVFNDQLERISSWRAAYPEQPMALWLYNTFPKEHAIKGGFNFYPAFFAPDAYRQYQFFKEKNIRAGIFQCGLNGAPDTYMQLCWMLDPDRTPAELLDEYFACYGKVGPHLKEFYNLVAARYADRSRFPKGGVMHQTVHLAWGKLGTKDLMDRLAAAMAKAEQAATTPAEKRRLAVWRYGVWDFMQDGYNAYARRQGFPKPEWSARRIASAAGDVTKVDWTKVPAEPISFYNSNTGDKTHLSGTIRLAHDGQWLYLELDHTADCPKLRIMPAIFPSDTWELFVAGQEGLPYRHYFSGADGRIEGMSNGEVNWRQNVIATESGPSAFGAKCAADCSDPAKWVQRIAFPLDNLIERPLKPGDVFYVTPVRVCSRTQYREGESFIQSVVPCATIHTTDRMAKVTLQP